MKKTLLPLLCLGLSIATVQAEVIKVLGEGNSQIIKKDLNSTRNQALIMAKIDAVATLIKRLNGPQAMNEAQPFLNEIIEQIENDYFTNLGSRSTPNKELITQVSLEIDDQEFHSILNDLGLAKKNSRNSPIMIVMDEYFGVPRDNSKPVKEYTSYFSDRRYSYDENAGHDAKESHTTSANSAQASRGKSTLGYDADNVYSSGAGGSGRSASHNNSSRAAASSNYNARESAYYSQAERQNDIQSFIKYVEYQTPANKPERNNQTLNAIAGAASGYDLRLLDSDLFRSKYLKGRSITIQQLTSDAELAKLAAAARQAKADWFMAGSSYIYDRGRSQATGQFVCDGAVSFKIYSVDDATLMGGETRTESATGATTDACRSNVAQKLGQLAISKVGPQILNYSKNRSMYGKDLTIMVKSTSGTVSSRLGDDLYEALEMIEGAENIDIRTQGGSLVEMTMSYKGSKPITAELSKALRKISPTLSNAERLQVGNTITLCLGGTQCK